jgi:hypothetical protein
MRVALRRPNRHVDGSRDLREGEVERVLQHDDLGLVGRDLGERLRELRTKLGEPGLACRIRVLGDSLVSDQRLPPPDALTRGDIAAGVDDEAMKPGREL